MALPLLCLSLSVTLAQTKEISTNQGLQDFFQEKSSFEKVRNGNNYYVLIRFDKIPNQDIVRKLKSKRIHLLEFRSDNSYLASIPDNIKPSELESLNIISVLQPELEEKLHTGLLNQDYPDWAVQESGTVDVAIVFFENTSESSINATLNALNAQVLENKHRGNSTIVARISQDKIDDLANSPLVSFVDVVQEPVDILNHENRLAQRVNVLNSAITGGHGLKGEGVVVGIGDGGELGEHLDFGSRIHNEANGTYNSFGDHGDHVAGII